MPIISSLQALRDTGDRIKKIDGVFSGTLSYIFNSLSANKTFSQVVLDAKQKGFTEPDPRDDLSGIVLLLNSPILWPWRNLTQFWNHSKGSALLP